MLLASQLDNVSSLCYDVCMNTPEKAAYNRVYMKQFYQTERGKIIHRKASAKSRRKRRLEAIALLGAKCVRCGITDTRCLQVDHINGGGCAERRAANSPIGNKVLKNPSKYQLLCANCNWIKRFENHEHN